MCSATEVLCQSVVWSCFRWTETNCEVVRSGRANADASELLRLYKAPTSADAVVTRETLGVELNRHNYRHKMHKLLNLEELTRTKIIFECVLGHHCDVMTSRHAELSCVVVNL